MTTLRLTGAQARRVALAAQGFGRPRPQRAVTMRDVQAQIARLAQFQIDSINVVRRAHYLPLYSRLGDYDTALLDRAVGKAPRRLFEYWGHAASMIDVRLYPAFRFRMGRADDEAWGSMRRIAKDQPDLVEAVFEQVASAPTPVSAREVEQRLGSAASQRREHWGWNWSATKTSLEWLFWCGRLTSAARNSAFERTFALPERVIPAEILAGPILDETEAFALLVGRAARALGVATLSDLADYFRLPSAPTAAAISTLVERGELIPVDVDGWGRPAWLHAEARRPRAVEARALVSPFDSVVFERNRLERLFDFSYRIEIYVPEPKRQYGYYVYPFLVGDRFVARVDLKANRADGVLEVRGAYAEPLVDREHTAAAMALELGELAGWLGLGTVRVADRGDLAPLLRARL